MMATTSLKRFTFGLLALSTVLFTGCMSNDAQGPSQDEYGSVSVSVGTGDINAAAKSSLSKGSTIVLSKLIVTFVSNAATPDTVRDTIVAGVHQGFVATSTADQTIDSAYVLKALRTWYVTIKTLDTKDSVVHLKLDTVANLKAGETRARSLTLNPRFVMYKANFSFPDSIATAQTTQKQKLNIKRLIMKVNGVTVVDSSATFAAGTSYSIGYDYVPVNTGTTVELSVVGNLTGWSFVGDSVMYRKTDITVAGQSAGTNGAQTTSLPYVGPVTGSGALTVQIIKVGLYQITAETDSTVVPKTGSK
jgi:hypothetical protein